MKRNLKPKRTGRTSSNVEKQEQKTKQVPVRASQEKAGQDVVPSTAP